MKIEEKRCGGGERERKENGREKRQDLKNIP